MTIRIEGASGDCASRVNGYFELVPNGCQNFRPQYRKMDDPGYWLVMMPHRSWFVTNTGIKESNKTVGYCYSVEHHSLTPDLVKRWKVVVNGEFTEQSSVSVTAFSPADWIVRKVGL